MLSFHAAPAMSALSSFDAAEIAELSIKRPANFDAFMNATRYASSPPEEKPASTTLCLCTQKQLATSAIAAKTFAWSRCDDGTSFDPPCGDGRGALSVVFDGVVGSTLVGVLARSAVGSGSETLHAAMTNAIEDKRRFRTAAIVIATNELDEPLRC